MYGGDVSRAGTQAGMGSNLGSHRDHLYHMSPRSHHSMALSSPPSSHCKEHHVQASVSFTEVQTDSILLWPWMRTCSKCLSQGFSDLTVGDPSGNLLGTQKCTV